MKVDYRYPRVIEIALLGYILVVIVLLTLSPFRFSWPSEWGVSWWGDSHDVPANFLLFLPVGYFFRLALPKTCPRAMRWAFVFGTTISLAIETLQFFLPDRLTSFLDVLGNGLGAAAGSVLCDAVRRRLDRMLPATVKLEHPLLNSVYLIVPLMWLAGVGVEKQPARVWLLAPLGVGGALMLTGLWRFRFAAAAAWPRPALALAVLTWFLFGAVSGLTVAPQIVAQCALLVFALTVSLLYLQRPLVRTDRRFEHKVLAAVWPWYAVYLLMMLLWPVQGPYHMFNFALGYPEYGFEREFTLRIAEQFGALTLFGYLLAESFGRRDWSASRFVMRCLLVAAGTAALLEIAHGFLADDRASAARWLLGSVGAGFGIVLYTAQLNVVQLLRGGAERHYQATEHARESGDRPGTDETNADVPGDR